MKIVLFGKPFQAEKQDQIRFILEEIARAKVEVLLCSQYHACLKQWDLHTILPAFSLTEDNDFNADYALSIGGDGTLLNVARRVGNKGIPILGINTGRLGFLSAVDYKETGAMMSELLADDVVLENHSQLCLQSPNFKLPDYPYALNEIAVLKRDISAMLHIHVSLNGEYLNDYQADGLIISTSTGSTAYALSVGGPILFPENPSIVLAPVAPHSLTVRTIVLSDRSVIDLRVESRSQNFLVALDGRSFPLPGNAQLRVVRADFPIQIVRRKSQSFVQTLRAKMMWGKDLRNT